MFNLVLHLLGGEPFYSFIMGFLDNLSKGVGAASSAVGLVGGVSSLIFGGSRQREQARYQMRLQQELNEQQQQYARENAATAYNRQRQLTQDTALLQKTGQQRAGLSTAGDFGGSPASVSPIAPPSAGSAPSLPDPNASMLAGIQAIQASANSLVQNRAAQAQAEGQELQNDIMRQALPEKVSGAKGEGMAKYAEGKKATATLGADVQQRKDEALITNNNLWKSEQDAAFASSNALSTSNTLLAQSLQAHELYEKAKNDKTMSAKQLKLFEDTYNFSVQAAEQNVINLRKQGAAIDASAEASRASAEASRASASYLHSQQVAQDISNSVNGDPKVMEAARTRLINAAKDAGPQSFGEYAWSIINDPNATTWQKWKAAGASILGWFERTVGGPAAESASRALGDTVVKGKGNSETTSIIQTRGKHQTKTLIKRLKH